MRISDWSSDVCSSDLLSLAGPEGSAPPGLGESHIRVATKYPATTRRWFEAQGIQAECIKLNGAMEIAPKLGLASHIVDLVSTGRQLIENALAEQTIISEVSTRLIVHRPAFKRLPAKVPARVEPLPPAGSEARRVGKGR